MFTERKHRRVTRSFPVPPPLPTLRVLIASVAHEDAFSMTNKEGGAKSSRSRGSDQGQHKSLGQNLELSLLLSYRGLVWSNRQN